MKLTLAEPKFLKESIGIISELVNDVSLKVDSNSLQIVLNIIVDESGSRGRTRTSIRSITTDCTILTVSLLTS